MRTGPIRIQRQRRKGWRMPANTVYVGRPTIWGNPILVSEATTAKDATRTYRRLLKTYSQAQIMRAIKNAETGEESPLDGIGMIVWRNTILRRLPELRGKNLACWCPLVDKDGNPVPCHADVLLELANK